MKTPETKWRKLKRGDIRPEGYQVRPINSKGFPITDWQEGNPTSVGSRISAFSISRYNYRAPGKPPKP